MFPRLRQNREELQRDDQVENAVRRAERRCGWRNQCGRMPSSDTRFSTPFDPTIDVLTAPASISVPTTATKPRNAIRSGSGPDEIHRQAADRIVEETAADRVGNDHHREERHAGREDQAVDER